MDFFYVMNTDFIIGRRINMGIFSLFHKKESAAQMNKMKALLQDEMNTIAKDNELISSLEDQILVKSDPALNKKGYADKNGLYPEDLILLWRADKLRINECNFPGDIKYEFEIQNPEHILSELSKGGYIEQESFMESLGHLKLSELKIIADKLNLDCKKTKKGILAALENAKAKDLMPFIKDVFWKRTPSGDEELQTNPYIEYFLKKHKYSWKQIDIDVWKVNKYLHKHPEGQYRDYIWSEINNRIEKVTECIHKAHEAYSMEKAVEDYSDLTRIQALFLEEEEKFTDALDHYLQYLYRWINLYLAIVYIHRFSIAKNSLEKTEATRSFIDESLLTGYQMRELTELIKETGIEGSQFKDFMIHSFEKSDDSGPFSYEEFANFILLQLNGQIEQAQAISRNIADYTIKEGKKTQAKMRRR
jgi:hypothetical protein